jgi:hypothetical protein
VSRFLVSLTPEFNSQALLLDGWTGAVHQALSEHYEWLATNPFAGSVIDSARGVYGFRRVMLGALPLSFAYRIKLGSALSRDRKRVVDVVRPPTRQQ